MKKINLFLFLISTLGVIASVASCDKNDQPSEEGDKTVSVLAVLENGRTWEAGDEVVINGVKHTVEIGGESKVTIEGVKEADSYSAAYDTGNGFVEGTTLTVDLPVLQSPSMDIAFPMVASNGAPNLLFKNILGTLKFSFTGSGKVTKMVLTSTGKAISGKATVSMKYTGNPLVSMASDAGSVVTVDLGKGMTLPGDVEVVLPAGKYEGFMITAYDADGGVMTGKETDGAEVKGGESSVVEVAYETDAEAPVYLKVSAEADADGAEYLWPALQPVYINGVPALPDGGDGTATAEFGPVAAAEMYYVSTSAASANGLSGSAMRIKIPEEQKYGASLASLNPAVGKSADMNVLLKYLAGVVEVKVSGVHSIRQAVLSGKGNRRLAGNGIADMSSDTYRLSLNSDASKDVRVDCAAGVDVTEGATFRFVIPADDYSEGFTVTLTDANGQVFSEDVEGVTVERNAVSDLGSLVWESAAGDSNNLSSKGCANSYMVHMAGTYSFLTRRVDNTPVNDIKSADWLWVSKVDGSEENLLISDVSYADGEITFTASDKEGNALIAAFDENGDIVWSWHIWLTDAPRTIDCENNVIYQSNGQTDGYYVMDRNLGATDATIGGGYPTFGLYYQWGRKDPFIGSTAGERLRNPDTGDWDEIYEPLGEPLTVVNSKYSQAVWSCAPSTTETGTVAYADAHPMHFMYCELNANQANWLGKGNFDRWVDRDDAMWRPFQKTNSDPCPPGYEVPRNGMWDNVRLNYQFMEGKGIVFYNSAGEEVWYPFAGYRSSHPSDEGALIEIENTNGWLCIWSSELMVSERSYAFKYSDPVVLPNSDASWAYGYNVRCVAE